MSKVINFGLAQELVFAFLEEEEFFCLPNEIDLLLYIPYDDKTGTDIILPGNSPHEITRNLQRVLNWANEPALIPTTGRNKESRQLQERIFKKKTSMVVRVALALLSDEGEL